MKNIFFNLSHGLKVLSHFNIIIGLIIIISFTFGKISSVSSDTWGSVNNPVETQRDYYIPTNTTNINVSGWNSENKPVETQSDYVFPTINTVKATNTATSSTTGWNSENKPVAEYGRSNYSITKEVSDPISTTTNSVFIRATNTRSVESGIKNTNINEGTKVQEGNLIKNQASSSASENRLSSSSTNSLVLSEKAKKLQNTMQIFDALKISINKKILEASNKKEISGTTTVKIDPTKEEESTKNDIITNQNSFGIHTSNYKSSDIIEVTNNYEQKDFLKFEDTALLFKDSNVDGISDYDAVNVYNIDPVKVLPKTSYEGKELNASEKIILGFDPTKEGLVKINHEEPQNSVASEVFTYRVQEVGLTQEKALVIKGTALPNSFITLYIYSTPVIVTVKTDSNGEWQYTLDKELDDGKHTVYTATVNNTGKILAKSQAFPFVKTAEAATLESMLPLQTATNSFKPGIMNSKYIYVVFSSLFVVLFIVIIIVGLGSIKSNRQKNFTYGAPEDTDIKTNIDS